jgi:calpain-15
VVVDDYFPANERGEPLFAKPACKCEIWVMVLEKCWAKLFGSYANIVGGLPHEVSHAFSAAPVFVRRIPSDHARREALWQEILEDEQQGGLFCCGTLNEDRIEDLGFVKGHAYSIVLLL